MAPRLQVVAMRWPATHRQVCLTRASLHFRCRNRKLNKYWRNVHLLVDNVIVSSANVSSCNSGTGWLVLDQAYSAFYVAPETSAKFGLLASNMKFNIDTY